MHDRIRILVFASFYLPGYKAGGPIRTISGMIGALGDEFDFSVITSDRDLGEKQPYPGIVPETWTPVGKARVMYLPPERMGLRRLREIVRRTPHDIVYLGGGFDPRCVLRYLLLRRLGLVRPRPAIVAPQGVFSAGALRIKNAKKLAFLALAGSVGLYHGVVWHVSSEFERRDVQTALRLDDRSISAFIAPNISAPPADQSRRRTRKPSDRLQVVFLSRISPKKNLDGALRILQGVDAPLDLHIYGPREDMAYWNVCEREMQKLPSHVSATYHGLVEHAEVANVMRSHDLFFLPTHGENFGHVIAEALGQGCPALIADNTAFRGLESKYAGWDLPLEDVDGFRRILHECAAMPPEEWRRWSDGARELIVQRAADGRILDKYRRAFRELYNRRQYARAA
ncbi:MAG: glycosyltransferase family 4 protein [Pirellulales bacterium]|nr:glycosyltransferase family 4 protein [Pirellulales bacterium]